MANPQTEDGYTKIANEIIDELCRFRIDGGSRQVLDAILRKTYGFNKKEDWVSHSQIAGMTKMLKGNVSRELSKLIDHKLVIVHDNKLRLNKNYEEWISFKGKRFNPKKLSYTITKVIVHDNKKVIVDDNKKVIVDDNKKVIVHDNKVIVHDKKVIVHDNHKRQYTKDNIQKTILVNTNREFGNSQINECRDYFLKVFQLPKEDGSVRWNRIYWNNLIKQSRTGVAGVKWLIDTAYEDEFLRPNITSAKSLYNKQVMIMSRRRGNITKNRIVVNPAIKEVAP